MQGLKMHFVRTLDGTGCLLYDPLALAFSVSHSLGISSRSVKIWCAGAFFLGLAVSGDAVGGVGGDVDTLLLAFLAALGDALVLGEAAAAVRLRAFFFLMLGSSTAPPPPPLAAARGAMMTLPVLR